MFDQKTFEFDIALLQMKDRTEYQVNNGVKAERMELNVLSMSKSIMICHLTVHNHFDKTLMSTFQPNIIPICLPSSSNTLVGQTGWVTGWGRLSEFGPTSNVLR